MLAANFVNIIGAALARTCLVAMHEIFVPEFYSDQIGLASFGCFNLPRICVRSGVVVCAANQTFDRSLKWRIDAIH